LRIWDRHPDADDRLTNFLLKYPVSSIPSTRSIGLDAMPNALEMQHARAAYTARLPSASRRPISAMPLLPGSPSLVLVKKILRRFLEKIPPAASLRSF